MSRPLVPSDFDASWDFGDGLVLLHYAAVGSEADHYMREWRFQHICIEGRKIAPALVDHVVSFGRRGNEPPSVTPSVLCRDCGLYGFIEAGQWRSVA